jgi:hypothetical protein
MTERAEILAAYYAHEARLRAGVPGGFLYPEHVVEAIGAAASELCIPKSVVADAMTADTTMRGG